MNDKWAKPGIRFSRFLASTWVTVAILIVSLLFIAESLTLKGDAQPYPLVVGCITAALCLIDLIGSFLSRQSLGQDRKRLLTDRLREKLLITGWLAATLLSFYVLGIIATVALSGAVYFRLFVTSKLILALLIGLAHAVAFWIAFDLLAGFNLYTGLLY